MECYPIDKNGNNIKEGMYVKFLKPHWDNDGNCVEKEVVEKIKIDEDGGLFANNYEEDVFHVDWSEMEVVSERP